MSALVHHDGVWADSLNLDERLTGPRLRIRDVLIDRPSKPAASTHSPPCIHTIMLGPPMCSMLEPIFSAFMRISDTALTLPQAFTPI
jgi:hypothetical protein